MTANALLKGLALRSGLPALVLLGGLRPETARADSTWEFAVQISATVVVSPPQISLTWLQDSIATPISYTVFRKAPADMSWGEAIVLPPDVTNYVDTDVSVGATYEYQVHKTASTYDGYGYVYSGILVPLIEHRGTVILIVDNTYADDLTFELGRLEQDLTGDGWTVERQDVAPTDSVTSVKAIIQDQYQADPTNVNCVFLFGHVPVPYSGDIAPDEHAPDHQGAWPADVYYGDMSGAWPDSTVNDTNATDPRNWNVPGDGKFDPSSIPGSVDLMVGRVDLSNLPGEAAWNSPPSFPSELDLLRQYLNKDHNFRSTLMGAPRRALVGDYFGDYGGYAFSASAWRNFAPFFGPQNITVLPQEGTWLNTLATNAYLWAYGCGPGNSYNSMNGLGNTDEFYEMETTDLVAADPQAVFTMIFGSWFGDWDTQDNLQRAVLATPTYGLACCWSGSPHWFCQHMALGQTIGFSTRLTQNNGPNGLYQTETNTYAGLVHIALMGDPTLRLHPVSPPSNVVGLARSGVVLLSWAPSSDAAAQSYYVYRAAAPYGPFIRLTPEAIDAASFTDSAPLNGTNTYMVRALKLEITPSGSYTNASQGIFLSLNSTGSRRTAVSVSSILRSPAGIVLTWVSIPGSTYHVAFNPNLMNSNWTDFNANIIAGGDSLSWTDVTSASASQRFYQVFQMQ